MLQLTLNLEPPQTLNTNVFMIHSVGWNEQLEYFRTVPYFAIDLETMRREDHPWEATDKDALCCFRNQIRTIQVGLPNGKVLIVDLGGWMDNREAIYQQESVQAFMEILREKAADYETLVIGHNLYFEACNLYYHFGIKLRKCRDTQIMSRMKYAGVPMMAMVRHDLGSLIKRELGIKVDKSQGKVFDWRLPVTNKQLNYCANDVLYPIKLWRKMGTWIKQTKWQRACEVECEVVSILGECYVRGFPVNIEKVRLAIDQYELCMAAAIKPFSTRFPKLAPTATTESLIEAFNTIEGCNIVLPPDRNYEYFDPPVTIFESFFERYPNLRPKKKRKKKKKEDVDLNMEKREELMYYLKPYIDEFPEVRSLVEWRKYAKHYQYLVNLEKNYYKGTCHGNYNSFAPKGTGRSSCGSSFSWKGKPCISTGINLQNPAKPFTNERLTTAIPQSVGIKHLISIRECFEAPKGFNLIIEDLPQAHMIIATESSRDPVLKDAYENGVDQHSLVGATLADIVYGKDPRVYDWEYIKKNKDSDPFCDGVRKKGKEANYSRLNQVGAATMSKNSGMTFEESENVIQAHKQTFPVLDGHLSWLSEQANYPSPFDHRIQHLKEQVPYMDFGIAQSFDGRELFLEKQDKFNRGWKSVYPSAVSAFRWLGCEKTIIAKTMIDYQRWLDENPHIEAHMVNLAHDEVNAVSKERDSWVAAEKLHDLAIENMKFYIINTHIPTDGRKISQEKHKKEVSQAIAKNWADKK